MKIGLKTSWRSSAYYIFVMSDYTFSRMAQIQKGFRYVTQFLSTNLCSSIAAMVKLIEQRINLKFLVIKKKSPKESFVIFGSNAMSGNRVFERHQRFSEEPRG